MPAPSQSQKERTLGIVLLKDLKGPVEIGNVHPAHLPRLRRYETEGIRYELKKDESLSRIDPLGVLVLRVES